MLPSPSDNPTLFSRHHHHSPQPFLEERMKNPNSLPILHIAIPLRQLRPEIDKMAPEQQIILRLNSQGIAHKGAGVEYQSAGHAAGYAIVVITSDQVAARSGVRMAAGKGLERVGGRGEVYISGSFCVSITAAMGMPKLETGPQKSVESEDVSVGDPDPFVLGSGGGVMARFGTYGLSRHSSRRAATGSWH